MPKMKVSRLKTNPRRKRVPKKVSRRLIKKLAMSSLYGKIKRRPRVTRVRRNPDLERARMRHRRTVRYIIVGFVEHGYRKFKRYFYTGKSFSPDKESAEKFSDKNLATKCAQYKLMPRLPSNIARLSVERV